MTAYEVIQLLMTSVPLIVAISGGLWVFFRGYDKLKNTVATLVEAVNRNSQTANEISKSQGVMIKEIASLTKEVREVQAIHISKLAKTYDEMYRDVEIIKSDIILIKEDISTMRTNQQAAASGNPETGRLEKLRTEKDRRNQSK